MRPFEFKDLVTGQEFDFISPTRLMNSFYLRCTKTGKRTYRDENGRNHRVDSVRCFVYHVSTPANRDRLS